MKKRELQIDVLGFVEDLSMVECKLIVDGRAGIFYMSKSNYEAFKFDGVFIRDGKEKDSANVLNTTHVFKERF
jgi:hypothetical protein